MQNGEVVELEGSGALTEPMITPYKSTCVSAEIGELCTSIGYMAFMGCSEMTTCTIGNGVTSIGAMAFDSCSAMTTCTIGSGVTSIGDYAFCACWALDAASRAAISAINQNALNCEI